MALYPQRMHFGRTKCVYTHFVSTWDALKRFTPFPWVRVFIIISISGPAFQYCLFCYDLKPKKCLIPSSGDLIPSHNILFFRLLDVQIRTVYTFLLSETIIPIILLILNKSFFSPWIKFYFIEYYHIRSILNVDFGTRDEIHNHKRHELFSR